MGLTASLLRGAAGAILATVLVVAAHTVVLAASDTQPWQSWSNVLQADHPLTGKIWDANRQAFVTPQSLAGELSDDWFILLGEIHDNTDHHRIQAWLIDQVSTRRHRAVVMEMIDADQATALEAYLATPRASAAGLGPAIGWEKSGWPPWSAYQPIAEATLRNDLRLVAGSPRTDIVRSISRNGLDQLSSADRTALGLDVLLPEVDNEALGNILRSAHCGLLPEAAIDPMRQVQRFRDATLASALVRAGEVAGSILIAGNGHVRRDRAVPWYLAHLASGNTAVSVMLVEVRESSTSVSDLIETDPAGNAVADYFWFTPRAERPDPCESLRKRFSN